MTEPLVLYERQGSLARIALNRPSAGNALNNALVLELDAALRRAEHEIDAKVIVLKARGPDFCMGLDVSDKNVDELLTTPGPQPLPSMDRLLDRERHKARRWEYLYNFPRPTIAQVQGRCWGLGLTLAMCCDICFASEDATFGDPSVALGLLPSNPLWTYFIGIKKTKDILYTGRTLGAREAEALGLINFVVPRERLEAEVTHYAQGVALSPGDGLAWVKEDLNLILEARGVGAAWRFLTEMQVTQTLQLRALAPEEARFFETREAKGLAAAQKELADLLRTSS
ncbi:MAG: enoyl-CoA hydratase/isomerase family protein [Chloroflexi bacterium]|nr:enoyl-CoA hydratase/isomerase family protein [Chloroflexota bacterium]